MDRIHREERLDRLAQCPMGHDTRHFYKWLDEIDELTKQNAKLLEALKRLVSRLEAGKDPKAVYERGLQKSLLSAKQAIAEGQS
jgi:hypothetical protein